MAKNVQQQGGSAESENLVIGLDRQIRVDTSNKEIRLHDGSTPGGLRIPNRDSNDARYQPRKPELDGITFDSLGFGFVVRLAPADYRLRVLSFDSSALNVVNPSGLAGDPVISLKTTIAGARTFSGLVTFNGGLVGSLTGPSVGLHTGNVVGNLTGNSAGTHTGPSNGLHTGGLNATGAVLTFDANQIPLAAINAASLLAYVKANAYKPGDIKMWYGLAADVEAGWFICDGSNGTPNMVNRFPMGAANDAAMGTSGGAATHNHGITVDASGDHLHVVNVANHVLTIAEIPSHQHANGVTFSNGGVFNHGSIAASPTTGTRIDGNGSTGTTEGLTTLVGGAGGHNHPADSVLAGAHTHVASSNNASSLPPYRALYYIMKGP